MPVLPSDSGTAFVAGGSYVNSISLSTLSVDAGPNLALYAGLARGQFETSDVTATWNSDALTRVAFNNNGEVLQEAFRLVAPDAGNYTLSTSWTTACPASLGAAAFANVHQTDPEPPADIQTTFGTSTTPSTGAVPSSDSGLTLGFAAGSDSAGAALFFTTPEAYTNEWRVTAGREAPSAASSQPGGTSNTHTFTMSASHPWCAIGIHIQGAPEPKARQIGPTLILRLRRAVSDFRAELDIRGWWRTLRRRMLEA